MDGRADPGRVAEDRARSRRAPLSGLLQFNATGAGNFDEPRYDVKVRVDDLFAGDEGVGQVSGPALAARRDADADFEAASPRLFVSGSGRLELTPAWTPR